MRKPFLLTICISLFLIIPLFSSQSEIKSPPEPDAFDFFKELVQRSNPSGNTVDDLHKFITLYSKFQHRPSLLTDELLATMFANYDTVNVAVDYIERIPIKKPETAMALIIRARESMWYSEEEKIPYISILQSVLEILAHSARFHPERIDYDTAVQKLLDIQFLEDPLYDKTFELLHAQLGVRRKQADLMDAVFHGVENPVVSIDNTEYRLMAKESGRKAIGEILQSQEVGTLDALMEINYLFKRFTEGNVDISTTGTIARRLKGLFGKLPYADISKKAPRSLRKRVVAYSREKLEKKVNDLLVKITGGGSKEEIESSINEIKNRFLVHQLKDYLLAFAYALNARNPKLKVFLNPNFSRLHDFGDYKERNPWNYSSTPPPSADLSGHFLSGGLSRLKISFAAKWHDHLFSRSFIYNPSHTQSMIINMLEHFPYPRDPGNVEYIALLVDFGSRLMEQAKDNQPLKNDVMDQLAVIASGYHYRKSIAYLSGKTREHDLYYTELKKLGERFLAQKKYLDIFKDGARLEQLSQSAAPPVSAGVYYRTFGSLDARHIRVFPPEVSNIFDTGWISGEMFDEFNVKLSWHLHYKKISPLMLGQVLNHYMTRTVSRFFSQNHVNDYASTYFLFRVFNNAHLRKALKDLQKQGHLQLK